MDDEDKRMVIKALIAEIHLRPKEEWKQGSNPLKEIVYNFPLENNPIEVFRGNTTSVHTKEQLLAMVREMVKTSVGEFLSGNAAASTQSSQPPEMSLGPSEQDIDAMVASLKLFDQS